MMKRRFRLGLPVICALMVAASMAKAADLSSEWNRCVETIQKQYFGAKSKQKQLDELFRQYGDAAKAADSRPEFVRIVNEMIKKLGDSHFELHANDQQSYFIMANILTQRPSPQPSVGAYFSQQKAGWRVEMVLNNSAAEKAGLRKGDVVLKANGESFSPITSLKRSGSSAVFEFERTGKSYTVTVNVRNADFVSEAEAASAASVKTVETNGKKIGYIKLWMMISNSFRTTLENAAGTLFRDTDAMILDLRDGFGGYVDGYADIFFTPPVLVERKGQQTTAAKRFGYSKPVVVLINEGTRSAKESLAYLLKSSKRATLVGTRTAGKLLGSSPFCIADWAILQVPVVDVYLDGKRFEGVGINPDIEVRNEFGPTGDDLILGEALRILSKD